ncbi:glutamate 5-kinase [Kordiimonas aquimaris]|uniref:glutamate 5-kinase n=1 Tax=Kordiimonas aquimaris TaxID=707591 RepID=UPI0021D0E6EC|nr:glutamate 5-kinase [Kordiimonas aquimaris]
MVTQLSQEKLKAANRIVIKVGSSLLIDNDGNALRQGWLEALAHDIKTLRDNGKQVILVSSGAIALGLGGLGLVQRTNRLEDAQAAAAIGQIQLAQGYQDAFAAQKLSIAQILLTLDDLEHRPRYLNARNTVETLIENGVIPVINENDTVATSEIRFGDNDRLAARVAQMCSADLLILLSDIDGLYSTDPSVDNNAVFMPVVKDLNTDIEAMAGPAKTTAGTGGMVTKLLAAKIALAGGCSMVIMNGNGQAPISRLEKGERSTCFPATSDPLTRRKQWIQSMMAPKGVVTIDNGAFKALSGGASLLPAGVKDVSGAFMRGDLVACKGPDGNIVAQGLVSYDAADAKLIMGLKTSDVTPVLGYAGRAALIHRDDLVIL